MKLLMISNYFESHRGGLELIGGRLVRELLRLGEDMRWLASDETPAPTDGELGGRAVAIRAWNTTERRLGIPFPIPHPGAFRQIARAVRRSDAVLLQDALYPVCVAAFLCARWWRRPVIIAQHVGIVRYRNPLFRWAMGLLNRLVARPMLARADGVAFFSEITARYFSDVGFRSPPQLVFTGVDTSIFRPVARERKPQLRRCLGLRPDRPLAVFVGRFVEKKGLAILARMVRQRPQILWVFAGWGPLDPGRWGAANVAVFSGLAAAELAPLYQAGDVFVLPSKGEGFPLVIQEALACGLPVVCSAETVAADRALAPFLRGVPLDEANPEATAAAFCAAIDGILAGFGEYRHAAANRFAFVSERYSWARCAAVYRDLILSAAGPPA